MVWGIGSLHSHPDRREKGGWPLLVPTVQTERRRYRLPGTLPEHIEKGSLHPGRSRTSRDGSTPTLAEITAETRRNTAEGIHPPG